MKGAEALQNAVEQSSSLKNLILVNNPTNVDLTCAQDESDASE